jgi:hypothetical protein
VHGGVLAQQLQYAGVEQITRVQDGGWAAEGAPDRAWKRPSRFPPRRGGA